MTLSVSSPDEALQQAIAAHRAGRLAQAEGLYRQVLSVRPDRPDVLLNCALTQLGQNKHADAVEALRRAVRAKPDLGVGYYHLGGALARLGRFDEAVEAFRNAVRLQPHHAESFNNLGNALLYVGDYDAAAEAYQRAIALAPAFPQAHNNLGWTLLQQGRPEAAEAALRRAVLAAPDYAEAHNNLGRALHAQRRLAEAARAFRDAIRLAPAYAEAHANLSASLSDAGDAAGSEAAAKAAIRLDPRTPDPHVALGNAIRSQGRNTEAEAHYREAIRIAPQSPKAYEILASCLQEQGRLEEAFAVFDHHAQMVSEAAEAATRHGSVDLSHKRRHDEERQAWLLAHPVPAVAPGARVAGPAVTPGNRVDEIHRTWRTSQPQMVVVDELLTPEALASLREYCLRMPVWHVSFERGYLGATPERGFTPPILAQIAEELRTVYPEVIGDHPLMYFWAFKYDSSLEGIRVHADFAAVNVNFWITPDESNLDPEHGGLVVYDVAAPLEWTFERYNAADSEIRDLIARSQGQAVTAPYRCNRAVIFDSDLFHETDRIGFKPGYADRRINVTLLFGRREDAAR
jgi:tetratricopeptide (TPR) repeat protein